MSRCSSGFAALSNRRCSSSLRAPASLAGPFSRYSWPTSVAMPLYWRVSPLRPRHESGAVSGLQRFGRWLPRRGQVGQAIGVALRLGGLTRPVVVLDLADRPIQVLVNGRDRGLASAGRRHPIAHRRLPGLASIVLRADRLQLGGSVSTRLGLGRAGRLAVMPTVVPHLAQCLGLVRVERHDDAGLAGQACCTGLVALDDADAVADGRLPTLVEAAHVIIPLSKIRTRGYLASRVPDRAGNVRRGAPYGNDDGRSGPVLRDDAVAGGTR